MERNVNNVMETETISKNRAGVKKIVVFCAFCFFSLTCLFAGNTTRYYKQTKIVTKDRKEQAGNGSGQFITFNDKGCYDSDNKGFTVNNGFLKFGKETAERVYYSGSSYWGEAMYIFTENYGRLNIVVEESGITYVYVLVTPPANVYTCALIKETKNNPTPVSPTNSVNPIVVNPINPVVVTPIGGGNSGSTTSSTNSRETMCKSCNGGGKCTMCYGSPKKTCTYCDGRGRKVYGSGSNAEYSRCAVCNGTGYTLCAGCKGSGNCGVCRGSGKIR